jgi:uncharacterized protein YceK
MKRTILSNTALILITIAVLSGCNNTFEPLQENDKYVFSMYGTLDVTADTQWVRVMPIGDRLFNNITDPNGTVVTLKNINTGTSITLNDSMFTFGGPSYMWNYWTTESILPETVYELKATTPDGLSSTAVVSTPAILEIPTIGYNLIAERGEVNGPNQQRLVIAEVTYWAQFLDDFGNWSDTEKHVISVLNGSFTNPFTGNYRFSFETRTLLNRKMGIPFSRIRVNNVYVRIATARTFWPSYLNLSDEEAVMPDVISNVTNGTGYIATISSRYLPVPR